MCLPCRAHTHCLHSLDRWRCNGLQRTCNSKPARCQQPGTRNWEDMGDRFAAMLQQQPPSTSRVRTVSMARYRGTSCICPRHRPSTVVKHGPRRCIEQSSLPRSCTQCYRALQESCLGRGCTVCCFDLERRCCEDNLDRSGRPRLSFRICPRRTTHTLPLPCWLRQSSRIRGRTCIVRYEWHQEPTWCLEDIAGTGESVQ